MGIRRFLTLAVLTVLLLVLLALLYGVLMPSS